MAKKVVCTRCLKEGRTKKETKGSFVIELLLWGFAVVMLFVFFPVAIIAPLYSVWRLVGRKRVCRYCGSDAVVPHDSPRAAKLLQGEQ